MSANNEEFDNWIKSVIEDLNSYSDDYDVTYLEEEHLRQLEDIFDQYIDVNHFGSKEKLEAYEDAYEDAKDVILKAHGQTDDDLQEEELMDNYMNSSNYP